MSTPEKLRQTDDSIQLLSITYKHMELPGNTRHRFAVAPMLDWTNSRYSIDL